MKDNNRDGEGCSSGTLQNWKYAEKAIKNSLIELIVLGELPFKFVEHSTFIKYSKNLQPKFNLPSRHTISRDIAKFYIQEREKLVKFLGNPNHTIHLTTDTWTSACQKSNYMVITAHFVDDNWVMHKRVINFKRISSHRGEDIGRVLLKCINEWGIKNVMTITVDNITLNDKALRYLIEHLPSMYDNGKHFHIRCMAHIINLVVKDGLKVHEKAVETIGLAVKYIKNSSQRIEKFKTSIKNTCDSNRFLIAECPTRWNSTYDMLKSVIELQEAFYNYSMKNASFSRDFEAIPRRTDFDVCQQHLREWEVVPKFKLMVEKMRLKYDKYWGDYKKINHYMYFAVLLDPTMKSEILGYGFRHLMENGCIREENEHEENTPLEFLTDNEKEDRIKELVYEVETNMGVLFALYNEKYGTKLTNNSSDVHKSSSTQSSNTTRRREDLMKDEEVIKEMKDALDKLKGATGNVKGASFEKNAFTVFGVDEAGPNNVVTLIRKLDLSNPLHLHSNDSTTLTIVSIKLKGTGNYNMWSCAMLLALEGRNQTGFIDNTCRSEESHRAVVTGSGVGPSQRAQSSVFNSGINNRSVAQRSQTFGNTPRPNNASRPNNNGNRRTAGGHALVCENYGYNGHIIGRCFKLIRSKVSHPNGTEVLITKVENLILTKFLILYDVLVVPEYSVTLVYVHKVARDSKFIVGFDESKCFLMSQEMYVKLIRIRKQINGLYYLIVWKEMYVKLMRIRKQINGLYCLIVWKAKQIREPFSLSEHKSTVLGELVHLDLSRPYRVVSKEGHMYFLTIVDDFTKAE
nr:zinc finger BED domain-containing protein RICESLEEPER 2 [Tanacetum cinerariifolium]